MFICGLISYPTAATSYICAPRLTTGKNAIFVGSVDSKETKFLLNADSSMAYAPPGYLLFVRQQTLMAQPFNADKLQLTGEAVPIVERVGRQLVTRACALFGLRDGGARLSEPVHGRFTACRGLIAQADNSGQLGRLRTYAAIRLSPDEKRIVLQRLDDEKGTFDIWLIELTRGTPAHLTFDPANDVYPIWSPDGSRIVFGSSREGTLNFYQKPSGGGNDELLFKSDDAETH